MSVTEVSPEAVAAQVLGEDISSVRVEPIKHGLTNESWRVTGSSGAVIVRISNAAEELLQIDRQSEAIVLHAVATAGLGADVLLCDPSSRVLVTRDLGSVWSEADAHVFANIERLAHVLRRLHALEAPAGVRRVDLSDTVKGYLRTLDQRGNQSSLTYASTRKRGANAALALGQDSFPCLCHNDVHHLNIVDDRVLRLIDWEYSGVGERMFDLASFCVYHRFERREREQLLHDYLSEAAANALPRLELACWLFEYVRDLWSEVRAHADS